jgi:hypothetical protein
MPPADLAPTVAIRIQAIEQQLDRIWSNMTPAQQSKIHLVNRFLRLKQLARTLKIYASAPGKGDPSRER